MFAFLRRLIPGLAAPIIPHVNVGQQLQGRSDTYRVTAHLYRESVWAAVNGNGSKVIVKAVPLPVLDDERQILNEFADHPLFRRLLDEVQDPRVLILNHLDDDLRSASDTQTLSRLELKYVAKRMLQAIAALHEHGYTHTDIKPDNVLVNYHQGANRFSDVVLNDFAATCKIDPSDKSNGHSIGAPIWRSPEAMLNARWGPPTDIWSFGATLMSLIVGGKYYFFIPRGMKSDHPHYCLEVLVNQIEMFGPVGASYSDLLDDDRKGIMAAALKVANQRNPPKRFVRAGDEEWKPGDIPFICRIMKLDPRDRPTAKELLQDEWFADAT